MSGASIPVACAGTPGSGTHPPHQPEQGYALAPTTYDVLREHVVSWDRAREYTFTGARHLFLRTDGRRVAVEDVTTMFQIHCLRAGVPVVPLSAVRDAYVTNALQRGLPRRVLEDRMGGEVFPRSSSYMSGHGHRSHLWSV